MALKVEDTLPFKARRKLRDAATLLQDTRLNFDTATFDETIECIHRVKDGLDEAIDNLIDEVESVEKVAK